jgi:hypothetical protein
MLEKTDFEKNGKQNFWCSLRLYSK